MARPSKYVAQPAPKSRCQDCDCETGLTLLTPDMVTRLSGPQFFICWKRRRIAEVGRGPVKQEP